MKAAAELSRLTVGTACGRPGCILLYTSEDCLFCDIAYDSLVSAIDELDLSKECITIIEISEENPVSQHKDIFGLPTIKICDTVISGLPSELSINDALLRALFNDCFC